MQRKGGTDGNAGDDYYMHLLVLIARLDKNQPNRNASKKPRFLLDDDTTLEIITAADLKELFTKNPPKVEMILEHVSYRLRKLTKEYMSACSIVSRVSDAEEKGNVGDDLKNEVKGFTEKLYD